MNIAGQLLQPLPDIPIYTLQNLLSLMIKPFLFLGTNPYRKRKMLQSYKGPLGRIDQNCSQIELSSSQSSSQASFSTGTLTFRLGQKQQTFWHIKPSRSRIAKLVEMESGIKIHQSQTASTASTTSATKKKCFFDYNKIFILQKEEEFYGSVAISSIRQQPISCCSLDFSVESHLNKTISCEQKAMHSRNLAFENRRAPPSMEVDHLKIFDNQQNGSIPEEKIEFGPIDIGQLSTNYSLNHSQSKHVPVSNDPFILHQKNTCYAYPDYSLKDFEGLIQKDFFVNGSQHSKACQIPPNYIIRELRLYLECMRNQLKGRSIKTLSLNERSRFWILLYRKIPVIFSREYFEQFCQFIKQFEDSIVSLRKQYQLEYEAVKERMQTLSYLNRVLEFDVNKYQELVRE